MRYEAIALDDMKVIMDEVTREITPLVRVEGEDREALAILIGSMLTMMSGRGTESHPGKLRHLV